MPMQRIEILQAMEGTHPEYGNRVAYFIYGLIVVSAIIVALESVASIGSYWARTFQVLEFCLITLFLVEFAVRLICAPKPLRYLFSFWGVVDFLACVPAILFLAPDLQSVRALRLIRILRVIKLLRIGRAYDRLSNAVIAIKSELLIVMLLAAIALYLSAVGIYFFERETQPEAFSSIPASLWWAVATMTTVGYGDIYPVSPGGKVFTGLVLLVGLALVALPAGLFTAALLDETKLAPRNTSEHDKGDTT